MATVGALGNCPEIRYNRTMSDMDQKPLSNEEATKPGPESTEPAYLAWKAAKIKDAVEHADAHPDDVRTHDQVFNGIKKNFRP